MPWQQTQAQYESEVQSIAQTVFENGQHTTAGNSIVYTFAFFYAEFAGSYLIRHVGIQGVTGAKSPADIGASTNIATVVIKNDCKTVITAYPGLPRQFNRVPNGVFKHGGTSSQHKSPF